MDKVELAVEVSGLLSELERVRTACRRTALQLMTTTELLERERLLKILGDLKKELSGLDLKLASIQKRLETP